MLALLASSIVLLQRTYNFGDRVQGLNRASSPANGVAETVGDAGVEYEIGADKSRVLGHDCSVGGLGSISSTFKSVSASLDITHQRHLMPGWGIGFWIHLGSCYGLKAPVQSVAMFWQQTWVTLADSIEALTTVCKYTALDHAGKGMDSIIVTIYHLKHNLQPGIIHLLCIY